MKTISLFFFICIFCDAYAQNDLHSMSPYKEEMIMLLKKATNSNSIIKMDSTLQIYKEKKFPTKFYKFSQNAEYPLKEYWELLCKRNTILKPLYDSLFNNANDKLFSRTLPFVPQFKELYVRNESPNLHLNDIYYKKFILVVDNNQANINENIISFFDLSFSSPLKKKVFIESSDFIVYKEYFQALKNYFKNGYFAMEFTEKSDGETAGLTPFDLNSKKFSFVLCETNKIVDYINKVSDNIYFKYVQTTPVRLNEFRTFDKLFISIPSEEKALEIEENGICYLIFNVNEITSIIRKGYNDNYEEVNIKDSYLTAGKTLFIIANSKNNVLYKRLFAIPTK